jgi:hypothetical protein
MQACFTIPDNACGVSGMTIAEAFDRIAVFFQPQTMALAMD